MTHQTTTEELAEKLRKMAEELEAAAAIIDRLRRKRYRKWNQPEVIVDVLQLSPKPLDREEVTTEMMRCGYEFRPSNGDPSKSVGVTLSNLQAAGRVEKVIQELSGPYGELAKWTARTPPTQSS